MRRVFLSLGFLVVMLAAGPSAAQIVSGGGETMIAGGFGDPLQPLKTNFAFRIDETPDGGVKGTFDCLALAPETTNGAGSGSFTHNVMYVTGKITELKSITKDSASFSGVATVTGIGAGTELPFDCNVTSGPVPAASGKSGGVGVTAGGAGATMNLVVSGLTFDEVVTNGAIRINPPKRKKK